MQTGKGHPSRDELLAMAYADDELAREARADFDQRLATEPRLQRMVVEYQRLEIVARSSAPPEPMDYEWQRLAEDGLQRAGLGLGWALLFVGGMIGAGCLAFEIFRSDAGPLGKLVFGALLAASILLFLCTLRARLRTLPYDPYTEVQR